MARDYSNFVNLAIRQINDSGRTATLVKPGEPTGPDYDPQPGEPTESDLQILETKYTDMYRDATLVKNGDVFWLAHTDQSDPYMEDTIEDNGFAYQIVNIERTMPGPTNILWIIHARGAGRVSTSALLLSNGTDKLLLEVGDAILLEGSL